MFYVWGSVLCLGTLRPTHDILPYCGRLLQVFRTHGNFREGPVKAKHKLQHFHTLVLALRYSYLTDEISMNVTGVNSV